ncbi:unnamed protein product [Protopolystoma xenopodis]|uniref:Uncharacterized protein n=1 Tax=Protopolystoma xenopodis TaxID=117903 RepID=A0A448X8L4_9PLAT|nr:unnamed protein product [Protopolystoma xenopodis]
MAKLTDDADYDAGETFGNVSSPLSDAGNHDNYYGRRLRTRCVHQVHCQMLGIMTTTMADDFGLVAFYIVALTTGQSCDNEVNPLKSIERRLRPYQRPQHLVSSYLQTGCERLDDVHVHPRLAKV